MASKTNLLGQRFGRLIVIEDSKQGRGDTRLTLRCDCGNVKSVRLAMLKQPQGRNIVSCGCKRREPNRGNTSHELSKTKIYRKWNSMRQRCDNPNRDNYSRYGALGIKVCKRWEKFENFYADMGPMPSSLHSIDRIDPFGNYEPSNCRWATRSEQYENQRNSSYFTYKGETKHINYWSRVFGLKKSTLRYRIQTNWSEDKIFCPPTIERNHI